jgi:tetratricopeptide (TPR) repeat protein
MVSGVRGVLVASITMVLVGSTAASAQCRTRCAAGEERDPYGCCVPGAPARRAVRRLPDDRAEAIAGSPSAALAADAATEVYGVARAALARGLASTTADRGVELRRAMGAALVFLSARPDDARAGRMRAVLVGALDAAGLIELAEREAAALGGPRPSPEPDELRSLAADTVSNLAWAHHALARRLDSRDDPARHARALARYARAVEYYRWYLARFADEAAAPSMRSELANALVATGSHLEAAEVLEALARATPARRLEALRRAVAAYQSALAMEVQAGRVELRGDPPPPSMRPPFAPSPAFPEPLARLFDARERLLAAADVPSVDYRDNQIENALWLYRYARFDEARGRAEAVLLERCDDRAAWNAHAVLRLIDSPAAPSPPAEPDVEEVCAYREALVARSEP